MSQLITLSNPSKMPGPSYSIPATACKTGAKLAKIPGSICSTCYALKGNYRFPTVKNALESRLQTLTIPDWVPTMVAIVRPHKYFRWHDSGDLQGLWHLKNIIKVCEQTPDTSHWLPTKESALVKQYVQKGGVIPANLTIRISASMIDSEHYTHIEGCLGSGVVSDAAKATCPAPQQGNKCGDCRLCWEKQAAFVTYAKH